MKHYFPVVSILSMFISTCNGFGIMSAVSTQHPSILSKGTALYVSQGIPQDDFNNNNHSEEFYRFILEQAKAYVRSSTAAGVDSTEQALEYLQSIQSLQNDCSVGTITGNDLCNIDDDISDLVFQLNKQVNQVSTSSSLSTP